MSERRISQVWRLVQAWLDDQEFKVTQSELAKKIDVQRSTLSQWKYGQTTPSPAHLRALSRVTRIYYSELTHALLVDLGYIPENERRDGDGNAAPRTQAGRAGAHAARDGIVAFTSPEDPEPSTQVGGHDSTKERP